MKRGVMVGVPAAVAAVIAVVLVLVLRGGGQYTTAAGDGFSIQYPSAWQGQTMTGSTSVGLAFAAAGTPSSHCPTPEVLVRAGGHPNVSLALTLPVFNQVEAARHHGRQVSAQRSIQIPGASEATYVESSFPAGGVTVHTYDILALSSSGVAYHVYAQGCGADLPSNLPSTLLQTFQLHSS